MPNWLRKSLVVFVSILTFGLVSPSPATFLNNNNNDKKPIDEREVPFARESIEDEAIFVDSTEGNFSRKDFIIIIII